MKKSFFLISFLPALAYWYLDARYPLKVALTGGIILAILEIILEKIFTKHVHALSKFNFFLIVFLGLISFGEEDGLWFKLQPAFTGVGIGLYLLVRLYKGRSLFIEMMSSMGREFPFEHLMKKTELRFSFMFLLYGVFMVFVAISFSTSVWLFFKTIGFYIVAGLFSLFEMIYLRISIAKIMKNERRRQILSRFV